MRTSSSQTRTIIKSLIEKTFSIQSYDATLIQEATTEPITLHGSGTISQDDAGLLQAEFASENPGKAETEFFKTVFRSSNKPQLIAAERYFTVTLTDEFGNKWKAERIFPSTVNFGFKLKTTRKIHSVTMEHRYNRSVVSKAKAIILGKYPVPTNGSALIQVKRQRHFTSVSTFNYKSAKISMVHHKHYLEIDVNGEINSNEFIYRFIESLSIFCGIHIRPLFIELKSGRNLTRKIYSVPHEKISQHLLRPISVVGDKGFEDFVQFVTRYLDRFSITGEPFFGYWHKVLIARQASLETMSLSLTVAIEGIIKTYFKAYGKPSDSLIADGELTRKIIDRDASIPTTIKDRLRSAIPHTNATHPPTAVGAITQKIANGTNYKKSWTDLRNSSAHADQLDSNFKSVEKHFDQNCECLTLLYLLLMIEIGYTGSYCKYPGNLDNRQYLPPPK